MANSICKKVWNHHTVQEKLKAGGAKMWLYDGNKLAWSTSLVGGSAEEIRLKVDLDEGRPNNRGTNHFFFRLKKTAEISFAPLLAYLQGKMTWDNSVLECMSRSSKLPLFLFRQSNHRVDLFDHLIRQKPSETLVPIRRNFYPAKGECQRLDELVEVSIGAYMAMKICNVSPQASLPPMFCRH